MHITDWIVMCLTLAGIVAYGVWKTRNVNSTESYILGDRELKWYTIGLSIMATQASAITFLSTPGQAFDDGMRFAQFYFGLPIAMVILAVFVLPIFYRLKVYTAYEYLEQRFDLKVRQFTAVLFLIGRGLAAGITIYAPAIILSVILDWNLNATILLIGAVVIMYTMLGGTTAVSQTQKTQMIIILGGIFVAFLWIVFHFPKDVSFGDAVSVAGKMGKLNIVDFEFDLTNKYNMWSALLGGTFLFLSYFGTDQSQVQRYLSGKTLTESRLGLMFNGIFKVPMQFGILFVGIMVFMFYQFEKPPIHFNPGNVAVLSKDVAYSDSLNTLQGRFDEVFEEKQVEIRKLITAIDSENENAVSAAQTRLNNLNAQDADVRSEVDQLLVNFGEKNDVKIDQEDNDYVFISYVTNYLPRGLVGLLLAVIFAAAMSSVASELSALASCTTIDFYKRNTEGKHDDAHYLKAAKLFTLGWGALALIFAGTATLFENLIEFVNMIGSLFYGTILGIFVIAFFFKRIKSKATLLAGILGEVSVLLIFAFDKMDFYDLAYLWLNLIGCVVVVLLGHAFSGLDSESDENTKLAKA